MIPQFVVVKKQSPFSFSRFHPSMEVAQAEAEKLCRRERAPFMVLAVVGEVKPVDVPTQWEFAEGFDLRGTE